MIDLSTNPFNLNDEQIQKVTKICSDMTLDEKIGQIFCPIGNVQDEKEIDEFIQKYKPGAMMYRPLPSKEIKRIHHRLQSQSKIPLLLAANLESGGNGICLDGTYFARQMSVAATNQEKFAYDLGMIAPAQDKHLLFRENSIQLSINIITNLWQNVEAFCTPDVNSLQIFFTLTRMIATEESRRKKRFTRWPTVRYIRWIWMIS